MRNISEVIKIYGFFILGVICIFNLIKKTNNKWLVCADKKNVANERKIIKNSKIIVVIMAISSFNISIL